MGQITMKYENRSRLAASSVCKFGQSLGARSETYRLDRSSLLFKLF
ncbi:MAG: hypothetical protein HC860_09790 [Alkalinema sp. RU_4_3]|nr:hypothetical protein [Alkalinema sp. RU_4_3]